MKSLSHNEEPIPKVLLVGGPDVDARIELMQELNGSFQLLAAGTDSRLDTAFERVGFEYYNYPMTRRVNPIADVYTFASLIRIFRLIRPDIIHSFDTKPCVFARLAGSVIDVPVVIGTLPGLGSLYVADNYIGLLLFQAGQ